MADRSAFGVVQGEDGQLYLPATQRPDGTWRKPRKVKDGYIPQEEMPVYESKGTQWKKDVPQCPGLVVDPTAAPTQSNAPMSKSAKKNAKRKEKKKQQVAEKDKPPTGSSVGSLTTTMEKTSIKDSVPPQPLSAEDINKKIKNLKKKLKQINELQLKIQSGELADPDPDQLAKIMRKAEFEKQIEDLELELDT